MAWMTDPIESDFVAAILADMPAELPKLVYADWLEERGDARGVFLRAFVEACREMDPAEWPHSKGHPQEWLDLIGYSLLDAAVGESAGDLAPAILRFARPALRLFPAPGRSLDSAIPVGASKRGGVPDLPPDFAWPPASACPAVYEGDTADVTELAGFLAQINLAEIAGTQATRDLPKAGLLSFFAYLDDNFAAGKVAYFPDASALRRAKPPRKLTKPNGRVPACRLAFAETLDAPEPDTGPWRGAFDPARAGDFLRALGGIYYASDDHFLGYTHVRPDDDPTPDRDTRHLITLSTALGRPLVFQIEQTALDALDFDDATMPWVGME